MRIKALAMDVDGTLTDGGIYIGSNGEIMKRFCVKDGYALSIMLPQMKIIPIVITGRESKIVQARCAELGITRIIQRSTDKLNDLKNVLARENILLSETAYFGDDLNDYDCVLQAGIGGCPKNAVKEIRKIADYITKHKAGNGAVREFIEWINELEEQA